MLERVNSEHKSASLSPRKFLSTCHLGPNTLKLIKLTFLISQKFKNYSISSHFAIQNSISYRKFQGYFLLKLYPGSARFISIFHEILMIFFTMRFCINHKTVNQVFNRPIFYKPNNSSQKP